MRKLRPVGVVLMLVWVGSSQGQNYQVFFPGEGRTTPPQQNYNTLGPNEVLGNYFNGQVPSSVGPPLTGFSQPQPFNRQVPSSAQPPSHQPQIQYNRDPTTYNRDPTTYNTNPPSFQSSPGTTSIPRQTHFFGNNYDFFRQFHDVGPQQSFQHQPFRNSFSSSGVGPSASPSTLTPSPTSSPSFTTPQFFTTGNQLNQHQSPFTFSVGTNFPSPTAPTYSQPQRNTITYPYTVVKQSAHPANSVQQPYNNGYEEAAKALGVTHGLRVITTETLKANPTASIATPKELEGVKSVVSTNALLASVPEVTPAITTEEATPETSIEPLVYTTSAPIIRSTGRSIARVRSTTRSPETSPSTQPQVIVISHNRQPHAIKETSGSRIVTQTQNSIQEFPSPPTTYRPVPSTSSSRSLSPSPSPSAPPPPPQPTPRAHQSQSQPHYQLPQGQNQGHGLYNSNHLIPGQLYTNTNGAYQAYYNGGAGSGSNYQHQGQGLEEIVPQIIELNIPPHKMIPVLEEAQGQGFDPFRSVHSFDPFGPPEAQGPPPQQFPPQHHSQPQQQPPVQIPAIIVTEAPLEPQGKKVDAAGEVYRVGPKGRLLKKRRRVRPPQPKQFIPNAIVSQVQSQPQIVQHQRPLVASVASTPERPTTYRPPASVEEDSDEQEPPSTYRSRFRYTPTSGTPVAVAPTAAPPPAPAPAADSPSQQQAINARLKSLERQIRFKNRNKSS